MPSPAIQHLEFTPPASALRSPEYNDEFVLKPGESRSLLTGAPWQRLAVLGDSLAEGVGDPTLGYLTLSWADRLAAELGVPGYVNYGTAHATAGEVAERQLDDAVAWGPDLAIVVAGGNDLFTADPDLAATERALEATYARLRATGADVVAFTLMDPSGLIGLPEFGRRIGALNSVIRHAAARKGVIVADFAERSYAGDRSIYSADLKHLNMRGQAIVASGTIERLAELIRNKQGVF